VLVGQIGNLFQRGGTRVGQLGGGGIAVEQGEDPAGAQVVDDEGQLGESPGQEVVQLIDEARVLARLGFEPAGDLAEQAQLGGEGGGGLGFFGEGVACAGRALDGIRLLVPEDGNAIVFVALRIATGDGEGGVGERRGLSWLCPQRVQEGEQVVGITPG